MILMFFVSTAWSFSIAGKVVKKLFEQKKVKVQEVKKLAKEVQIPINKHVHKSGSSSHGFIPSQIKCEFLELKFSFYCSIVPFH